MKKYFHNIWKKFFTIYGKSFSQYMKQLVSLALKTEVLNI